MKYMFASDIHGSAYYCKKMLEAYKAEKADRLILLGDLLYHGPRNDLPKDYAPKEVIAMLNEHRDDLYVVRGNCDAEVDQMVLHFPIMADYCIIMDGERTIYASHGHVYHEENLPPLKNGDIFIHGHTHVLRLFNFEVHIFQCHGFNLIRTINLVYLSQFNHPLPRCGRTPCRPYSCRSCR